MHSQDHADSEYVLNVQVDRKRADFTANKQTNKLTYRHSALYTDISIQIYIHAGILHWSNVVYSNGWIPDLLRSS